ncbi:hypothetical protein BN961_02166 [Afipia felis]|uniref:Uncharacterized protein n=1 Tax=Afipia felis TaxID=1035 RepID=A0A090N7K2_AFIFE|nr:hypothetical protein [Afipia felis]CEG08748.1 hypothetical protein BN961_02166 [Afipia felis]
MTQTTAAGARTASREAFGKASARKSFGEYKAVIVYPNGRTEILGKCERPLIWRGKEALPGGLTHFVRGKTFANREDAIARAQREIDGLFANHTAAVAKFNSHAALAKTGGA